MKPEHFDFGGGASGTILHPAVAVAMVISILLILTLPRRQVIVPFLLIAFLSPLGQQLYIGGMHWLVLRIVILAGCARLLLEKSKGAGKLFPNGLNGIDRAFVVWAFYRGLAPILLFHTSGVVPLQMAFWLQAFGGYFLLRYLIQDVDDIARAAKTFALLTMILGACMANERIHEMNIFGYLGGIPIAPLVRDGLIRSRACFGHPILAGCFGATLVPLFYWLWKSGKSKGLVVAGMLGSSMMVFFSASSTPALACAGGIGALFLWPIRGSMRLVRWGIVLTLVGLQLVMKAPVWFIIGHVNVTGASDASGRAHLIDTFIRHFKDWWLVGTNQTGNWGWSMWDLCNGFVQEGETGGLVALIAFIAVISRSFGRLGKMRRQVEGDKKQEWLYWSLCAVMFAHVLAYFGVSYFDQTEMWWFAFLAMVSAATATYAGTIVHPAQENELEFAGAPAEASFSLTSGESGSEW
ncbi:MAG TPA: hypothetical protein VMX16_03325 [Terriglobia bacterium]|nr:hypothetical protein [Terriglobia bacterium]